MLPRPGSATLRKARLRLYFYWHGTGRQTDGLVFGMAPWWDCNGNEDHISMHRMSLEPRLAEDEVASHVADRLVVSAVSSCTRVLLFRNQWLAIDGPWHAVLPPARVYFSGCKSQRVGPQTRTERGCGSRGGWFLASGNRPTTMLRTNQ